jgi:hypothetical protein
MVLTGNARAGWRGAIRLCGAPPLRKKAVSPPDDKGREISLPATFNL